MSQAVRLLRWFAVGLCLAAMVGCGSGYPVAPDYTPAVLSLSASGLPAATAGTAYNGALAAKDGSPPYTFTISQGMLPQGLNLSAAGVLTGTATVVGTYQFTVTVSDTTGARASAAVTLVVSPAQSTAPQLLFPASVLPAGVAGQSYTAAFTASGGTTPYSYALTGGTLPLGLTLSSAGVISGSPSASRTSSFTVTASDAGGQHVATNFSLTIRPSLSLLPATLPSALLGASYTATVSAANGAAPISYSLSGGGLPPGLVFSSTGTLSGTPSLAGTYGFTITATDASGQHASAAFSLTVTQALVITTPPLGPGQVNATYSAQFYAAGGTQPYTWAVTTGSVPPGFALTPAGMLSGTATTQGTFAFTMTATDAAGQHASQAYTLQIAAGLPFAITTPALGRGPADAVHGSVLCCERDDALHVCRDKWRDSCRHDVQPWRCAHWLTYHPGHRAVHGHGLRQRRPHRDAELHAHGDSHGKSICDQHACAWAGAGRQLLYG